MLTERAELILLVGTYQLITFYSRLNLSDFALKTPLLDAISDGENNRLTLTYVILPCKQSKY